MRTVSAVTASTESPAIAFSDQSANPVEPLASNAVSSVKSGP